MTTIDLHIERLVLDGVALDPRHARQMQGAVEKHLAHLLTTGARRPALERGGAVPTLSGETIGWQTSSGPAALGEQVAGAVYRSFYT
jgi:hypothetical protein